MAATAIVVMKHSSCNIKELLDSLRHSPDWNIVVQEVVGNSLFVGMEGSEAVTEIYHSHCLVDVLSDYLVLGS